MANQNLQLLKRYLNILLTTEKLIILQVLIKFIKDLMKFLLRTNDWIFWLKFKNLKEKVKN